MDSRFIKYKDDFRIMVMRVPHAGYDVWLGRTGMYDGAVVWTSTRRESAIAVLDYLATLDRDLLGETLDSIKAIQRGES